MMQFKDSNFRFGDESQKNEDVKPGTSIVEFQPKEATPGVAILACIVSVVIGIVNFIGGISTLNEKSDYHHGKAWFELDGLGWASIVLGGLVIVLSIIAVVRQSSGFQTAVAVIFSISTITLVAGILDDTLKVGTFIALTLRFGIVALLYWAAVALFRVNE